MSNYLFAQEKKNIINKPGDSTLVQDSGFLADTAKFEMRKSPWGAVLRSAVVPGLGQIYNDSYWKVPLIWGTLGYLIYQWDSRNKLYSSYRELYSESIISSSGQNELYRKQRDFYRDQRDLLAVFIGLTYFLNLVDAFVDAHLFDLSLSKNIFNSNALQLSLRVRL